PPVEYMQQLREICDDKGIVLIADEVQTGIGRTGKMFALDHFGIKADIVTMAKSLGGGMPLSAIAGKAELMDSVHPGGLGGTYGGNPVACAAALAVLEVIESEDLLSRAEELGIKSRQALLSLQDRFPVIGQVRGLGPMLAMELVSDPVSKTPAPELAKQLTAYCHAHGLLVLDCGTLGNNVRTLMPLVITDEQLNQGMQILEQGLERLS
ncbi:MAG: aminotransferase class III-fold pyridoxal phosphate-dependent enzyme, partial [Desulfarculaceae bacterium]|nr:aminotransferase class III-fold pyridoxal phosphate-dependent enzyme [Desulfarculaceae bacterium]MCF8070739.1 aminotransferase class III-fold pyridoxal phosphate-dependent enzyme [Desulfarculaceae bacterium]